MTLFLRTNMKRLLRGMSVRFPDGHIEVVTSIFRFPTNTRFRKKGRVMFQTKNWLWHTAYDDNVEILGFKKH